MDGFDARPKSKGCIWPTRLGSTSKRLPSAGSMGGTLVPALAIPSGLEIPQDGRDRQVAQVLC